MTNPVGWWLIYTIVYSGIGTVGTPVGMTSGKILYEKKVVCESVGTVFKSEMEQDTNYEVRFSCQPSTLPILNE